MLTSWDPTCYLLKSTLDDPFFNALTRLSPMEYYQWMSKPLDSGCWIGALDTEPWLRARLGAGQPIAAVLDDDIVLRMSTPEPSSPRLARYVHSEAGSLIVDTKLHAAIVEWGVTDVESIEVRLVDPLERPIDTAFWLLNPTRVVDCIDAEASEMLRKELSPEQQLTQSYLVLPEETLIQAAADDGSELIRPLGFESAILFRADLANELSEDFSLCLAPLSGPLD